LYDGAPMAILGDFLRPVLEKINKERRMEETTGQKYNGLPYSIGRP